MDPDRAILIVDDEDLILMSLRMQLRTALGSDFRYETALSAAEALEVFEYLIEKKVRVVLVITDWLMPGMKGDEFLLKVRAAYPQVKTLMLSGQTDQESVSELKGAGVLDVFLKKPWERDRLVAECRRLLDVASG